MVDIIRKPKQHGISDTVADGIMGIFMLFGMLFLAILSPIIALLYGLGKLVQYLGLEVD